MKESSTKDYRNKLTINQRGGTIEINNSTDREEIKISQYSGSNISINNVVTNELATNNKQTTVLFDEFRTVGNTNSLYVEKDNIHRVGGTSYELKGHITKDQVVKHVEWREKYKEIASINSQFNLLRGQIGQRTTNPDLSKNSRLAVNNSFNGYVKVPEVKSTTDEVTSYAPIPNRATSAPAQTTPDVSNIDQAFGQQTGTSASGVIRYGANFSSSTQDGQWVTNTAKENLKDQMLKLQDELSEIESKLGDGGDEIASVKRHSIETIGAVVNNYPSIRIDDEGRSCVTEIGVSKKSVFRHFGELPLVEEVDNASNFPCGTKTLTVGNRYNVMVGSGGVQIKTTGPMTFSGTSVKLVGTLVNISGDKGATLNSSTYVDIFAPRIMIRSPRQVLLDSSVGIAKNLIVSGSSYTEGETYVNHISAPVEVQQTYETKVFGKLVKGTIIGVLGMDGNVYAVDTPNTVELEPHSHHFNNVPLKLYTSNEALRNAAMNNSINKFTTTSATQVVHEFKAAQA